MRPSPDAPPAASPPPTAGPDGSPIADPCAVDPPDPVRPTRIAAARSDPKLTDARMPFVPVVSFWSTRDHHQPSRPGRRPQGWPARASARSSCRPATVPPSPAPSASTSPTASRTGDPRQIIAAVKKGALGLLRATDVDVAVRAHRHRRQGAVRQRPCQVPRGVAAEGHRQGRISVGLGPAQDLDAGGRRRHVHRPRHLRTRRSTATRASTTPSAAATSGPPATSAAARTSRASRTTRCPPTASWADRGIVRDLLRNADLAIANHESPIPGTGCSISTARPSAARPR